MFTILSIFIKTRLGCLWLSSIIYPGEFLFLIFRTNMVTGGIFIGVGVAQEPASQISSGACLQPHHEV